MSPLSLARISIFRRNCEMLPKEQCRRQIATGGLVDLQDKDIVTEKDEQQGQKNGTLRNGWRYVFFDQRPENY